MGGQLANLKSAIDFTRNGATVFSGIGALALGETRLLASRVGQGYGKVVGIIRVLSAAPGATPGTLTFEQSVDDTVPAAWEVTNTVAILPGTSPVPFSWIVVGKFIRARYGVVPGEVHTIRFGASLML